MPKQPIDVLVGERIRAYRLEAGMTQQQLADKVGITFQQLQKYEKATNRVSASRLYDLARALKKHINDFFDAASRSSNPLIRTKQELYLLERFNLITPEKQKLVLKLIKDL